MGGEPVSGKVSGVYRWAWAFYLALAIAGILWIGAREGSISLAVFVRPDRLVLDLGSGLAAGLLLVLLWEIGKRLWAAAERAEDKLARAIGPLEPSEARAVALLSALAEEVFFRGAMQGSWGFWPAAVLFTLLHIGPGPEFRPWTAFTALAGLALGGLTAWSGTLLPAIVAHFTVNLIGLDRLSRRRDELSSEEDGDC